MFERYDIDMACMVSVVCYLSVGLLRFLDYIRVWSGLRHQVLYFQCGDEVLSAGAFFGGTIKCFGLFLVQLID